MPMLFDVNIVSYEWNSPPIQSISASVEACHKEKYRQQYHLRIWADSSAEQKGKVHCYAHECCEIGEQPKNERCPNQHFSPWNQCVKDICIRQSNMFRSEEHTSE